MQGIHRYDRRQNHSVTSNVEQTDTNKSTNGGHLPVTHKVKRLNAEMFCMITRNRRNIFLSVKCQFVCSLSGVCVHSGPQIYMGALKTQVRKRQVRNSAFRKDGKRMYGKRKYESAWVENASTENASTMQTFSQIKKFGISQVSVVHFQVGWASGLQIVFFLR